MKRNDRSGKALFLIAIAVSCVFFLAACSNSSTKEIKSKDDGKINIVTSIFPAYDFVRAIVGDRANVTMLIHPGSSIHSFDPSPANIKDIVDADVFVYIGGESEAWVDRILASVDLDKKDIRLIPLINEVDTVEEETVEGMEDEEGHGKGEGGGEYDEHIWTSPRNAVKLIRIIAEILEEVDGKNAEAYAENAENYRNEIQKLNEEIEDVVQTAKRKKIVVADRFPLRYFVDAYGLDYAAAFGACSDQTDAGVATVAHLVNTVKAEGVPYIYYVELSTMNVAKSVGEQTGAELLLLHSCQNVSKSEFEEGATYLSLMRQNAENLKKGLN